MIVKDHDGVLYAEVYLDDLSPEAQEKLLELIGENANFDSYPIALIPIENEQIEA